MKLRIAILSVLIFASLSVFSNNPPLPVDSIMKRVMGIANNYNSFVESYTADLYVRVYISTLKKNFLYKHTHLIPKFVLNDPKSDEALIETLGTLQYNYPNHYMQQIRSVNGSLTRKKDIEMIPYNMFNINVYAETSNDETYLMPLRFSTAKYYKYKLRQHYIENNTNYSIIDYTPQYEHPKLLQGTFIIEDSTWRVVKFRAEGIDILGRFVFETSMGERGVEKFLPQDFSMYQTLSYFGNSVSYRYLATLRYNDVSLRSMPYRKQKKQLNVSNRYRIGVDSIPLNTDSAYWAANRPIPLQATEEEVLLNALNNKNDDEPLQPSDAMRQRQKALRFASLLVQDFDYRYKLSKVGYAGLFNPALLGYSSKDGVSFRQKVSFSQDLYHQRMLDVNAFVGYMFKRKELLADITSSWNYNPRRLGRVTFSAGVGNTTYSTIFRENIENSLEDIDLHFEDVALDYYKDYYAKLYNNIELVNGLQAGCGFEYHIRRSNDNQLSLRSADEELAEDIDGLFGVKKSFMPFIRIIWTPEQYHRFEGKQKIYVRSPYPTFQLEYAKSVGDVLGSTTRFDRIEVDISQHIPFGLMKCINYHVGAGIFINQRTEYFNDFVFFSKNNFPEVWESGIGGGFNMLDRHLYNASDRYMQAHLMFETPFIFSRFIPAISPGVIRERIYVSQLHTTNLKSYSEIGYGVGNRFVNLAFFGAFKHANKHTEFDGLGVKVSFELK